MFRHLLIPTDGSPLSRRGVRAGVRLAKALGARVTGLHVSAAYAPLDGAAPYYLPVSAGAFKRFAALEAARALQPLRAEARRHRVRCAVRSTAGGQPWQAILRAARAARCDAIVMATHGRSALGGLILGSEATQVLARSRLPVLLVR